MFAKQIVWIISIVLLLSGCAFGQGEFLRPGEGGFGLAALRTTGENAKGYGFSLGFSIEGEVDLAFAYSKNEDANAVSYCPSITYHAKNNQPHQMIDVALSVGYARTEWTVRSWSSTTATIDTDCVLFALGLAINFYPADAIMLQPSLSGAILLSLDEDYDRATDLTAGFTVGFAHKAALRPFISFGVGISDNSATDVIGYIGGGVVAVPQ